MRADDRSTGITDSTTVEVKDWDSLGQVVRRWTLDALVAHFSYRASCEEADHRTARPIGTDLRGNR